jgi:flavin-dependent dehydrogenase
MDGRIGTMSNGNTRRIVVIGAGPIGLAAAAHLVSRGYAPIVLEAGDSVGAHVLAWAHV